MSKLVPKVQIGDCISIREATADTAIMKMEWFMIFVDLSTFCPNIFGKIIKFKIINCKKKGLMDWKNLNELTVIFKTRICYETPQLYIYVSWPCECDGYQRKIEHNFTTDFWTLNVFMDINFFLLYI